MTLLERFLTYVNIPTSSDERSETVPTAEKEFVLADRLAVDMKAIGIADAHVDGQCYVYGHIPASPGCVPSAGSGARPLGSCFRGTGR